MTYIDKNLVSINNIFLNYIYFNIIYYPSSWSWDNV